MENIPTLIDGVEVKFDELRGRCLITTVPRRPGDIVFKSMPYCFVLHPKLWGRKCNYCFQSAKGIDSSEGPALQRCTGCKLHHYCSKECQRNDWKDGFHKKQCKHLHKLLDAEVDEDTAFDVLLVGKTLWKMEQESGDGNDASYLLEVVGGAAAAPPPPPPPPSLRPRAGAVLDLAAWAPPPPPEGQGQGAGSGAGQQQQQHAAAAAAALAHGFCPPGAGEGQVLRLLERFQCNNFGVADALLNTVGAGCYPAGAALNHGCSPNAALLYDPGAPHRQVVRVLAEVAAGEELVHAYVDAAQPTADRRAKLAGMYGFHCACPRCENGLPVPFSQVQALRKEEEVEEEEGGQGEEETVVDLDPLLAAAAGGGPAAELAEGGGHRTQLERAEDLERQAQASDDPDQELELMLEALSMRTEALHPANLQLYRTKGQLLTLFLVKGDLDAARESCKELVAFLRLVYAHIPNAPMLGLQLYTLGDLHRGAGDYPAAIQALEEAGAICESEQIDVPLLMVQLGTSPSSLKVLYGAESEMARGIAALIRDCTTSLVAGQVLGLKKMAAATGKGKQS